MLFRSENLCPSLAGEVWEGLFSKRIVETMFNVIYPSHESTIGIQVEITRYVDHDPQPGIVECELIDAHGLTWKFLEKTAIVSHEDIDENSTFPMPGLIAGEAIHRFLDESDRNIIRVDTSKPFCIESIGGETQFDVFAEFVVEWEKTR